MTGGKTQHIVNFRHFVCLLTQGCGVSQVRDTIGLNAQMMTSGFVSLLMSLFCVAFMFRQSLSKGGTGGPRLTWSLQLMIPRLRRAIYFPIHPRKGFQLPHLLVNPYYCGVRDAVLHWPKLVYVFFPTSPRGVPAWRSWGGQVCLEPHKVDFHWKEESTQKGLWKEKYSSYPPVCPSSQT